MKARFFDTKALTTIFVSLVLPAVAADCGGGTTAPSTATGMLSVSAFTATTETYSVGSEQFLQYSFRFQLVETSGTVGMTTNTIIFTLQPGTDVITIPQNTQLAAGATLDLMPLHFSYSMPHSVATTVSVSIVFTDDAGHPGRATATASISPLQRFTVNGTVTDSVSGLPIVHAELFVGDRGFGNNPIYTDSAGHYSAAGVAGGNVTADVMATGYDKATRPLLVSSDTTFDVRLDPVLELRVTGTAFHVVVTEQVGSLMFSNVGTAPGFSFVFPGIPVTGDKLALSAQIDNPHDPGSVTVSIYKHGQLILEATTTGFLSTATVQGTY